MNSVHAHAESKKAKRWWRSKKMIVTIVLIVLILLLLAAIFGLGFSCAPGGGPGAGNGEGEDNGTTAGNDDEDNGEATGDEDDVIEPIDVDERDPLDYFLFRFDTEVVDERHQLSGTLTLPDHETIRLEVDEEEPRDWESFRDRLYDRLRDHSDEFADVQTVYVERWVDEQGRDLLSARAQEEFSRSVTRRLGSIERVEWIQPGDH